MANSLFWRSIFFIFGIVTLCFSLSADTKESLSRKVLVSVSPHKFFVNKIAGDTLDVVLMVPAGASAHTYEPTPKQMINAGQGDIWFRIGESFETKAIQALKSHNPRLQIVDLRENLSLISDPTHVCKHHKGCVDLHFWLSPRMAKEQARTIARALSETYPEHAELYRDRLAVFLKELDDLDGQIVEILKGQRKRTMMVSHPAYGYFARDYGLNQFSIEFEGKDPTPQLLTKILAEAKKEDVKTIFVQPQYSSKGARLIADEIGAKVVILDPYSEDFYTTLLEIATQVANQ